MSGARRLGLLVLLLLCATQARADALQQFLRGMSDSTNVYFGPTSVAFDTTGIDSLLRVGGDPKLGKRSAFKQGLSFLPISTFHRAEGHSLGLAATLGRRQLGQLSLRGSYGLANEEGRYRFGWKRDLWRRSMTGDPEATTRVILSLGYARETLPFAPEHAQPFSSSFGAFATGRDRQSVYESRGFTGELALQTLGFAVGAGYHGARDQSMPRATRATLWGRDRSVPEVTRAREESYDEATGFLRYRGKGGLYRAGVFGRFADRDRWRVRAAAAQKLLLGGGFDAHFQAEGGLAARGIPPQLRFELGGPLAVPSLGFGDEAGDRLLLGKCELVHGVDLMRALHLPHPAYFVVHPAIFVQAGSTWRRGEGPGEWSSPPRESWRGAAGISLVHLPGIPSPANLVRMQMAWPIGRESGCARFSLAVSRWFDVID